MAAPIAPFACTCTPQHATCNTPLTCAHAATGSAAASPQTTIALGANKGPTIHRIARPLCGHRSNNASGVERPTGRYWSGYARRGLTATRTCHVQKCTGNISITSRKNLAYDTLAGSRLGTCTHVRTSCVRDVQLRCSSSLLHPPLADGHSGSRRPRSQTWG